MKTKLEKPIPLAPSVKKYLIVAFSFICYMIIGSTLLGINSEGKINLPIWLVVLLIIGLVGGAIIFIISSFLCRKGMKKFYLERYKYDLRQPYNPSNSFACAMGGLFCDYVFTDRLEIHVYEGSTKKRLEEVQVIHKVDYQNVYLRSAFNMPNPLNNFAFCIAVEIYINDSYPNHNRNGAILLNKDLYYKLNELGLNVEGLDKMLEDIPGFVDNYKKAIKQMINPYDKSKLISIKPEEKAEVLKFTDMKYPFIHNLEYESIVDTLLKFQSSCLIKKKSYGAELFENEKLELDDIFDKLKDNAMPISQDQSEYLSMCKKIQSIVNNYTVKNDTMYYTEGLENFDYIKDKYKIFPLLFHIVLDAENIIVEGNDYTLKFLVGIKNKQDMTNMILYNTYENLRQPDNEALCIPIKFKNVETLAGHLTFEYIAEYIESNIIYKFFPEKREDGKVQIELLDIGVIFTCDSFELLI